ncbi:G-protein coupled receptor 35-like [Pelobates fuscus]|uniref:G-protein coupled receptor 35-like n=1 Tax=Pelobates fuscus TaxID=191477 RepID=UPI002FE4B7D4
MKNSIIDNFRIVALSLIFIFGTLFNLFVIWVFSCKMKKWTETRVYMMSLLASDCCLLVTIPLRIHAVQNELHLTSSTCLFFVSSYFMNTYMSIFIVTLISVDRYVAIKFPMKARTLRSPKNAAIACGTVFLFLLAMRMYVWFSKFNDDFKEIVCFRMPLKPPGHLPKSLYDTIFMFCIPLLIVTFCSVEIIRTLKKKDVMSTHEHKMIQKSIYIVCSNFIIFLLCFLPVTIGKIVRFIVHHSNSDCYLQKNVHDYIYAVTVLSDLNCCLDAVSYYFVATEFWENAALTPKLKLFQRTRDQTENTSI